MANEDRNGGRQKPSAHVKDDGVRGIKFEPLENDDTTLPDYRITDYGITQLGRKHDKPFILAVGLHTPHRPWTVPQKYDDLFPAVQFVLPP